MTLRLSAFLWMFVLAMCLLMVTGCQSFPIMYNPEMTAQQIKSIASDKNAGVVCTLVPTPWGQAKVITINLDQRVIDSGGISVDPDCKVTISTQKLLPVPRAKPEN